MTHKSTSHRTLTSAAFRKRLLHWFDQYGRHDLPWQVNKTPYRIWVSEIMLQQTQVQTVIPYYDRFMTRFPTLETLANAQLDDVLNLWTGLGYYARARHLHRTAQIIISNYEGRFPKDIAVLQSLPGIGRSTAGAISSIAFQAAAPILDGNVKRVLTRLHGIQEWPGDPAILEQLWSIASEYTPQKRVDDYTQAIMDLGATVCRRANPLCEKCPFQIDCIAHAQGIEKQIPAAKTRKPLPIRTVTFLIIYDKNTQSILLHKRSDAGVWKGLFSFLEFHEAPAVQPLTQYCAETLHISFKNLHIAPPFRHTFSHYHLDITPAYLEVRKKISPLIAHSTPIWYKLGDPHLPGGLPAPVKRILEHFSENIAEAPVCLE